MELSIFDLDRDAIGVLDTYESLIWTDRYYECGDFEIYTPYTTSLMALLQPDYILQSLSSNRGMIIETRKIVSSIEKGPYITITGRSLESILSRRIAWNATTLSGNFQTELLRLFNENIISPVDTDRTINNFIFVSSTDEAITELTIDADVQGMSIYDIVQIYCSSRDIGFRVDLIDGSFAFSLYSGANRSDDQTIFPQITFSPEFDNLWNSNYLESISNYKTIALVYGAVLNKTIESSTVTGVQRREVFVDLSGISDSDQLEDSGIENLAAYASVQAFDGEADIDQVYKYDVDFFLGDIVNVANELGMSSKSRIIEVIFSHGVTGTQIRPTFVTVDA